MNVYRHDNVNLITGAKSQVKAWTVGVPVEDGALKQLYNVANMPFIFKHVAAMPDVHVGEGATIGSVIPTTTAIMPAAVGVDIGCVDADTEFLTLNGWKRIADYQDGDSVLVFTPGCDPYRRLNCESAFFETPKYIKLECDEFWKIKTKYGVNQVLSDEHRVLYYKYTRAYDFVQDDVMSAKDLAEKHNSLKLGFRGRFLTTFNLVRNTSVKMSDSQIRVMIMVCADGSFGSSGQDSSLCYLRLKKIRKIERAQLLLKDACIDFKLSISSVDDVTTISFYAPEKFKSLENFWQASPDQLRVICDEVFHWDGNFNDSVYFTRDKASADFMSYAFAACGKRSVMREDTDASDGKIDYRVFAHTNTKVGIAATPEKNDFERVKSPDGLKYCFTTSTGYWVMRRGGVIAITGNCGMMAVQTTLKGSHLPQSKGLQSLSAIRAEIEAAVPHGRTDNGGLRDVGSWRGEVPTIVEIAWMALEPGYKKIIAKHSKLQTRQPPENQLGTLGTGNHFIELCLDEDDSVWVMLHSGSRGVGNRIGSYFIDLAKREAEKWFFNDSLPDIHLAFLPEDSLYFDDFIQATQWAQQFAATNRELMMRTVLKTLKGCKGIPKFEVTDIEVNCHHNYVEKEFHFGKKVWVTRKGAIRAQMGELGIIPGSMGAKSFIVRGLGNRESFCSASHGAGRKMSRTEARNTFTLKDHRAAVEGVECRIDADVIDETPGAYKDIDAVMEAQKDLVAIEHTLKQVLCIKG
ncbi:RtcB family protein [Candidatus Pacearchaeota archaeon]|nr:RtcB family protein [Candidatus Pacearchaeota archaeon]